MAVGGREEALVDEVLCHHPLFLPIIDLLLCLLSLLHQLGVKDQVNFFEGRVVLEGLPGSLDDAVVVVGDPHVDLLLKGDIMEDNEAVEDLDPHLTVPGQEEFDDREDPLTCTGGRVHGRDEGEAPALVVLLLLV